MRNMSNVYRFLSSSNLRLKISQKRIMLAHAENGSTMWDKRDARELKHSIHEIEVELAAREAQQKLFK